MSPLAPILQGFFTDKLIRQRRAGPNTIAAYRDTCRLLIEFASRTTGVEPSTLDFQVIDADLITAFLRHLETERAATPRCTPPNTPTTSAECWRSHRNAATGP
jgi:integrase/recombinase XerD